jgi:hypothetical protein
MNGFYAGLGIGIFGGGVLSFLYATYVVNKLKGAAAEVGVFFQKVEGKWQAIKKVL